MMELPSATVRSTRPSTQVGTGTISDLWYWDSSGGRNTITLVLCSVSYEPYSYEIKFDGNGADEGEMESISATYDEEYTLTANAFTREGYTFTGWNTEADGSGTSYEDGATVSNLTTTDGDTVTLYAQWEEYEYIITVTEYTGDTLEAECSYEDGTIILYVVDANSWEQLYVATGDTFSLSEILTGLSQEGRTYTPETLFLSFEASHTGGSNAKPRASAVAVATTEEPYWYNITPDELGEAETLEASAEYGSVSLDGTLIFSSEQALFVHAQLALMVGRCDYTIAFDGNGADEGEMEAISATYDEEYTLTTNAFTRKGYTFTGWNTEADGSGTSYEDGEIVSNLTTTDGDTVTLYAQWEKNTVSISAKVLSQEDKSTVLCGVEFSLFELICEDDSHDHTSDDDLIDVDNYDTSCWELFGTYTSDETTGEFILEDLYITEMYRLVETKTVENYLLPSGQWNLSYATESLEVSAISNPPAVTIETDDDRNETLYLYNSSSYDLPLTGLFGTSDFYKIGTTLIVFGLCVSIIAKLRLRKRKVSVSKIRSLKKSVHNARRIINNWDKNS